MKKKQTPQTLTLVSVKPLALALILGPAASLSVNAYELIDLGENVVPKAINNLGVIVGASNTDQYPTTAFSRTSAGDFVYINGGTSANAVNDEGLVAGSTVDGAFIGNRQWSDYGAFGINELGEVAGYKVGKNTLQPRSLPYNPAIFDGNKWDFYDIARLYARGTRKDVYADRFILNGINVDGFTVGYKYRYGLAGSSSILIDPNVTVNDLSDVIYLPTYGGSAVDINDSKIIAGITGNNTRVTPVIYSRAYKFDYNMDSLTILPVLEGGLHSHAYDINEYDEVVGYSESATGNHAVLWDQMGEIIDLHTMMSAEGWVLTSATAMNDQGEIVGTGTLNGVPHGYFLTNNATVTPPTPIDNQPPVAVIIAEVTSGKAPLTVEPKGSESSDSEGASLSYAWDFGDGSSSAKADTAHVYDTPGTYVATLTVTDDQGLTNSAQVEITVRKGKRK